MSVTIRGNAVIIHAQIEEVWAVLTDLERYPLWNPFTVRVESSLIVGTTATLHVRLKGRALWRQKEIVDTVEPPHILAWTATKGMRHLVASTRYQTLEKVSDQLTLYRTHERFRGPFVLPIMAFLSEELQRGFDSVGTALKAYVERRYNQGIAMQLP